MQETQNRFASEQLPIASSGGVSANDAIVECTTTHRSSGVMAALRYLNSRTRFRFTGVYRAESPALHNVVLFDRENPALNVSGAQSPLEETYCAITCATEEPFVTRDALKDARLAAHAARDSVISYAGVPMLLSSGSAWGSLCHWDVRPRLLSRGELEVLQEVAPLFLRWLEAE